jgi:hypothetical protein
MYYIIAFLPAYVCRIMHAFIFTFRACISVWAACIMNWNASASRRQLVESNCVEAISIAWIREYFHWIFIWLLCIPVCWCTINLIVDNVVVLVCDTVFTRMYMPTFRRNVLCASSGLKRQSWKWFFSPEDGKSMFLRNVVIYLRVYAASQPRITTLSSSPPRERQISQFDDWLCIESVCGGIMLHWYCSWKPHLKLYLAHIAFVISESKVKVRFLCM